MSSLFFCDLLTDISGEVLHILNELTLTRITSGNIDFSAQRNGDNVIVTNFMAEFY